MNHRVLTKTEAAQYLGLSGEAFARLVQVRPLPLPGTRAILYDIRDLDLWLDGIKCREKLLASTSTSDPADGSSIGNTEADESLSALHSALKNATKPRCGCTSSSPKRHRNTVR